MFLISKILNKFREKVKKSKKISENVTGKNR